MADQPNSDPAAAAAQTGPDVSGEQAQEPKEPGFFEKLFTRGQPRKTEPDIASDAASKEQPKSQSPQRDPRVAPLDELSDAELDEVVRTHPRMQRRVQAETDRREAKRQADAAEAERKRLRTEDPYAYAEQEEQAEHQRQLSEQWNQAFATFGSSHDQAVLDPVVLSLPKGEQERILKLEGAGRGLEGRKLIVTEALKALEKHWLAEGEKKAEARLRKNPAFRKQMLLEGRQQSEEPESVEGVAPPNGHTFEDLILADYKAKRGRV